MKIGIMTFWWSDDNYGQLLQCYALQKYLRDAGHDAYLIRYDPRNDYEKTPALRKVIKAFNPVKLFDFLLRKIVTPGIIEQNKQRRFDEFRNKYIRQSERIYYSYRELVDNPPEADVYIVGSDQVWNHLNELSRNGKILRAFLLDFGKAEAKRIAYAASFGRDTITDDFADFCMPLLRRFDYVSVREKSGVELCRQMGVKDAKWVPDPTMLLTASDYRALYSTINQSESEGPYCLLYMLKNECDFPIKAVYEWAKIINIKVLYITGNLKYDKYEKVYATILEWLYLIDKAEYVITNSFHCSIFSLLFQKKFGIIPLKGKLVGMNSRFVSLFEQFGIGQRFIGNSFDVLDTNINWNKIGDIFKKIRSSCSLLDYIQKE
jgi:hypothetical protein